MKTKIKTILSCCAIAIALTVTAVGLTGSRVRHDNMRCRDIDIHVVDSAVNRFTTREEMMDMLDALFGGYRNRYVDSVNLYKLEKIVRKCRYIEECRAYFTSDGMLHLNVSQCTPVMKMAVDSAKWYLDRRGECFPIKDDWCAGLIPLRGRPRVQDREWTAKVASMAVWIAGREEWRDRVTALQSAPDGQISLSLEGRDEKFVIGQPVKIKEKFARIEHYLDDIADEEDCKPYREVNVKYRGQIVCK